MSDYSVLLVDDEEDFLMPLVKKLTKRGFKVTTASSGEEAIETLADLKADAAVLDVRMKGMDGITALREIKAKFPMIEVIMLTGHANMEAAVTGMNIGAFDYLMKPIDFDEFLFKLEDACKSKRLNEQKANK